MDKVVKIENNIEDMELSEEEMNEAVLGEEEYCTEEDLKELLGGLMPKIQVDMEELNGVKFDKKAFQKGVKSVSELCGQFIALTSVGISKEDAFTLLVNRETCSHNLEMAKVQGVQIDIEKEKMSV